MSSVPGVRGLFYVRAAALGWYVLSTLMWSLLPSMGVAIETWFRVSAGLWLITDIAVLVVAVPFSRGRQGTAAESAANALVMLLGVALFLSIIQALPELGGPSLFKSADASRVFYFTSRLVFAAAEISLWLSLTRSLATPSTLGPAFYSLLALGTALSALQLLLQHDRYMKLIASPAFHWGRFMVGVAAEVLPLIVLGQLMDSGGAAAAQTSTATPAAATSPGRDIAIGAAFLGGGLIVTLVSYSAASSGAGGGRYVVTTGAIGYGLVRLVRGFVRLGG